MKASQQASRVAFARIQEFLDLHAGDLPGLSQSRACLALDDVLRDLDEAGATQQAELIRSRSLTKQRDELRHTLVTRFLRPLRAVARLRASHAPCLRFVSSPASRPSDDELIYTARRAADAIEEGHLAFPEDGIDEDFHARFVEAIEGLRDTRIQRGECDVRRMSATEGISGDISRGRKIVRVLDALVLARIGDNPGLTAEWRAVVASRSEVRRGSAAQGF